MNTPRRFDCSLIFLLLMMSCVDARTEDVCAMKAPPVDSKVRSTHAGKLYTYPRSIDATYTGCRVTWLENGQRLVSTRIEAGNVRTVEITEPDGPARRCDFDAKGALTVGDPTGCLPRDAWLK
jgi:hypothetical protein